MYMSIMVQLTDTVLGVSVTKKKKRKQRPLSLQSVSDPKKNFHKVKRRRLSSSSSGND